MQLARMAAERGIDVHVVTNKNATLPRGANYIVHPVVDRWNWNAESHILSLCAELAPDVIDILFTGWMYDDHPMITLLPAKLKQRLPATHLCAHIESLGGVKRENAPLLDVAARWVQSHARGREDINYEYGSLIRDSDSVIFLNERDKDTICTQLPVGMSKFAILPPPPIMPIIPPLDEQRKGELRQELSLSDREPVIAFYGFIYPGKGLETLFAAISQLRGNRDPALVLIGGPPEQLVLDRAGRPNYVQELHELAKKLGIADCIVWAGYSETGSTRPSELLRVSDFCVLPFDDGLMMNNSSFSFAAGHGLPIISTHGERTEQLFVNRENILLVGRQDAGQLASAITELQDDAALRARIAGGAQALVEERFNWDKLMAETLRIWSEGP